jgi:hypothetical protein
VVDMVGTTTEWWTSLNYVMNYVCLWQTMHVCELIYVQVDEELFA